MKISRKHVLPVIAVMVVLIFTAATVVFAKLDKGDKAPDFKLKNLDGKTVTLDDIRKDPKNKKATRVVLLDFWATWCGPCQAEAPHLQKLHEKYADKGLVVVGVSLDRGGAKDVKPFVKKHKLTYTVLVDPKAKVGKDYGVRYFPTAYIIDKNGEIRNTHVGYAPGMEKELEKEIKNLL